MKNYLGRKVRMKSNIYHFKEPNYYPTEDKVGIVIDQKPEPLDFIVLVRWPYGSTSEHDTWFVGIEQIYFEN